MKIGIKIGEGRGKKNRKMIEAEGINSLSYSLEWKKDGWRGRARQGFSRWEAKSLALVCA